MNITYKNYIINKEQCKKCNPNHTYYCDNCKYDVDREVLQIICPTCGEPLTLDTDNSKDGSDYVCFNCGFNKKI